MGGPGSGPQRGERSRDRGQRDWYQLERWRKLANDQLQREPLCARCLENNLVTPATVADHIEPHRGNWNRFILGQLQSLCAFCHAGPKHAEEVRGFRCEVDADGWPIDPRHPINRKG